MPIEIREYYNAKIRTTNMPKQPIDLTESFSPSIENSLIAEIEGIHVGPTRNFTRYTDRCLKESIPTWLSPYKKPLILHHNEDDGKIIGRIQAVDHKATGTRSGTPALLFTVTVSDEESKQQVKDGRLSTVSVGVIGRDVTCSICGGEIIDENGCVNSHARGNEYDGEICYWDVNSMEGKELSYVIVPSDVYSDTLKVYEPKKKGEIDLGEGYDFKGGEKRMTIEELKKELEKLQDDLKKLNEELQGKVKTLEEVEKEKDSLMKEKEELEKKLKELEAKDDGSAKIAELEKSLQDAENKIKEEKALREAAESSVLELKESAKEIIGENLLLLRSSIGKPITESMIKDRSFDSIKDAVKDLKEELGSTFDIYNIKKVNDPTITENTVTKKDSIENIDLREGLENLFIDISKLK